ncbi:L-lactate permease [Natronincola ferrireducens]|uniref:L-lactate permease n=1 Tax=Natronincola ferrireducens TaxID=393762 RepID=A0A1G9G0T8_9FIRM|nr:L-lactate permease [Natronincola ferrireducens]SDK94262.1 lactate permease [Natronincola ferrireducens]
MSISINLFMWVVAFLPIIVLLLLMVKFQWGAAEAAPVGLLTSLIVSITLYKANWELIALESAKGIWNAFTILIVIWPAILIYEVTNEAKAFQVFRKGMQKLTPNELLQILAIGWVFVSFLQGITGFGVPIAVGAPLLVGIGVAPIWAVIVPLLAHAWAGTFGTLAVAWQALLFQTGFEGTIMANTIALWATSFIWIINFITGLAICWFYGGKAGIKKGFPAVVIISLIHGGGQLIVSQVNQTLCAFVMTCVALGAVFLIGKSRWYRERWSIEDSKMMERTTSEVEVEEEIAMTMNEAFLPYYVLTGVTLFVLLVTPLNKFLGSWKLGLPFPATSTGYGIVNPATDLYSPFSPLTHAGTFLLIAGLVGYWYFCKKGNISKGGGKRIFMRIVEKTAPSTIAIVGLIIMSRLMSGTGQTVVLASGTANVLDKAYVLLAPAVGLLGSFMTSSNMASNILFGQFQQTTAEILGVNQMAILGAQTAGGAIGNSIAPGSIILGTTTAGILGQEGYVLRKTLPIALGVAMICGIILYVALIVL